MKTAIFLIATASLFAKAEPEAKIHEPAKAKIPAVTMEMNNKSVIVIDPKARAADYAQAFSILRKDKPTAKIVVQSSKGSIPNVTSVTTTQGGTLLIVKYLTNQGVRSEIIPVENITEISYLP